MYLPTRMGSNYSAQVMSHVRHDVTKEYHRNFTHRRKETKIRVHVPHGMHDLRKTRRVS